MRRADVDGKAHLFPQLTAKGGKECLTPLDTSTGRCPDNPPRRTDNDMSTEQDVVIAGQDDCADRVVQIQ
jgi:hypothetical protein